jgi:hypothetical protein
MNYDDNLKINTADIKRFNNLVRKQGTMDLLINWSGVTILVKKDGVKLPYSIKVDWSELTPMSRALHMHYLYDKASELCDGIWERKPLRVLSLGAGVQSSTLALLAKHGEVPMFDCAIFADSGWETKNVYVWLEWLEQQLPFKVYHVSGHRIWSPEIEKESLITDPTKANIKSWALVPMHLSMPSGKHGQLPRHCTESWKIRPIQQKLRQLLGLAKNQQAPRRIVVHSCIGISTDEFGRMKHSSEPWVKNVYPLIEEVKMSRQDCLAWMRDKGYPEPPRSACVFCPFRSNVEWSKLTAEEMQVATIYEKQKQECSASSDVPFVPYLHRSLKPIDQVDFKEDKPDGGTAWQGECDGICGL